MIDAIQLAFLVLLGGEGEQATPPEEKEVVAARIPDRETGFEGTHATGSWGGLRDSLVNRGVHFSAGYAGEGLANVSGGIRRGVVYEGLLELGLELDTEKLRLWKGGVLRATSLYPHGRGLSEKYTGDILTASNIDAYDSIRLYELWYEQRLFGERFSIRLGQLVADEEFTFTQSGGSFLNSAFGWPAFISANVPNTGPAYFVAAPGLRMRYDFNDSVFVQAGVYDGDTFDSREGDPHINAHGTHIHLSSEQGAFSMAEIGFLLNPGENPKGLPGQYKLGGWFHTADFASNFEDEQGGAIASSGLAPRTHPNNFGVYAVAEQMVWREEGEQGLSVFARAGIAPRDRSFFEFTTDLGLSWSGMLPTRDEDIFGVGFTYARISRDIRRSEQLDAEVNRTAYDAFSDHESVLEAFYTINVTKFWSIQPDIQWIFHPGGSDALCDALVLGVRTSIVF